MGIPHSYFEERLEKLKDSKGVSLHTDLRASDLKELVEQFKNVYVEAKDEKFPSGDTFYEILHLQCRKILDSFWHYTIKNPN